MSTVTHIHSQPFCIAIRFYSHVHRVFVPHGHIFHFDYWFSVANYSHAHSLGTHSFHQAKLESLRCLVSQLVTHANNFVQRLCVKMLAAVIGTTTPFEKFLCTHKKLLMNHNSAEIWISNIITSVLSQFAYM